MSIAYPSISELPIAGGSENSFLPLFDLLRSRQFEIVVEQEMRVPGSDVKYFMYLSSTPFTTLSTDSIPNMTMFGELTGDIEIQRSFSFGPGAEANGDQQGSLTFQVPENGVSVVVQDPVTLVKTVETRKVTNIRRDMVVDGWPIRIFIGRPSEGFNSFHLVASMVATKLAPTSQSGIANVGVMQITFSDDSSLFNAGILSAYLGTGGVEGTEENKGQWKPRHYGAPSNVTPVLIDPQRLIYQASDRQAVMPIPNVYDGAAVITPKGTLSTNTYAGLQNHIFLTDKWVEYRGPEGTFIRLRDPVQSTPTVDFADVMTVPQIIKQIVIDAGIPQSKISLFAETFDFINDKSRSESWIDIQNKLQNIISGYLYLSEDETVNSLLERLTKGIDLSRYQDRFGVINFQSTDYRLNTSAERGEDYIQIPSVDLIDIVELEIPSTLWPPNFREVLAYDRNHTVMGENDILGAATDARRQYVQLEYRQLSVTPAVDIKSAVKTSIDPPPRETYFKSSDQFVEEFGRWLLSKSVFSDARGTEDLMLRKRQMFTVTLPIEYVSKLEPLTTITLSFDNFYPDGNLRVIGQVFPISESWTNHTMTLVVFAQTPTFNSSVRSINPQTFSSFLGFKENYLYLSRAGFLDVYNVSSRLSPILQTSVFYSSTGLFNGIVNGNTLYAFNLFQLGLGVFDITTASSPTLIRTVSGPAGFDQSWASDAVIVGNYLYVGASTRNSILVFDITNPTFPTFHLELAGPSPGNTLRLVNKLYNHNNTLYAKVALNGATNYESARFGLAAFDVSNPALPVFLQILDTGPFEGKTVYALSKTQQEGFVYGLVANFNEFLPGETPNIVVLDLSVPTFPVEIQSNTIASLPSGGINGATWNISVSGDYMYVVRGNEVASSDFVFLAYELFDSSRPGEVARDVITQPQTRWNDYIISVPGASFIRAQNSISGASSIGIVI